MIPVIAVKRLFIGDSFCAAAIVAKKLWTKG